MGNNGTTIEADDSDEMSVSEGETDGVKVPAPAPKTTGTNSRYLRSAAKVPALSSQYKQAEDRRRGTLKRKRASSGSSDEAGTAGGESESAEEEPTCDAPKPRNKAPAKGRIMAAIEEGSMIFCIFV
jgi:hypothetical protein